jgi:leader peptidase (prepilin peptidase) / N-methyltransferase
MDVLPSYIFDQEVFSWLLALVIAPFIGSFLGVIIDRVETPQTILWGRSACPHCQARLATRDLVPLASWLMTGGRCRHCGKRLGIFYPLIELAALGVALWSGALAAGNAAWAGDLLGWTLLALAVIDARHFLLPDFLTLPLIPLGFAANAVLDPDNFDAAVIGAAAGFLVIIAIRQLYWRWRGREGIGLGDAKLLAAAGAWVGWVGLPSVVLIAALVGLAVTLIRHLARGSISLTERVPFGSSLCFGIWIVWLYGPLQ